MMKTLNTKPITFYILLFLINLETLILKLRHTGDIQN
jgi:hypothetical protein